MKKSTKEEKCSMKNITLDEYYKFLNDAPIDIQHLHINLMLGIPVGTSLYDRAKEEHPEYFYEGSIYLMPKNN